MSCNYCATASQPAATAVGAPAVEPAWAAGRGAAGHCPHCGRWLRAEGGCRACSGEAGPALGDTVVTAPPVERRLSCGHTMVTDGAPGDEEWCAGCDEMVTVVEPEPATSEPGGAWPAALDDYGRAAYVAQHGDTPDERHLAQEKVKSIGYGRVKAALRSVGVPSTPSSERILNMVWQYLDRCPRCKAWVSPRNPVCKNPRCSDHGKMVGEVRPWPPADVVWTGNKMQVGQEAPPLSKEKGKPGARKRARSGRKREKGKGTKAPEPSPWSALRGTVTRRPDLTPDEVAWGALNRLAARTRARLGEAVLSDEMAQVIPEESFPVLQAAIAAGARVALVAQDEHATGLAVDWAAVLQQGYGLEAIALPCCACGRARGVCHCTPAEKRAFESGRAAVGHHYDVVVRVDVPVGGTMATASSVEEKLDEARGLADAPLPVLPRPSLRVDDVEAYLGDEFGIRPRRMGRLKELAARYYQLRKAWAERGSHAFAPAGVATLALEEVARHTPSGDGDGRPGVALCPTCRSSFLWSGSCRKCAGQVPPRPAEATPTGWFTEDGRPVYHLAGDTEGLFYEVAPGEKVPYHHFQRGEYVLAPLWSHPARSALYDGAGRRVDEMVETLRQAGVDGETLETVQAWRSTETSEEDRELTRGRGSRPFKKAASRFRAAIHGLLARCTSRMRRAGVIVWQEREVERLAAELAAAEAKLSKPFERYRRYYRRGRYVYASERAQAVHRIRQRLDLVRGQLAAHRELAAAPDEGAIEAAIGELREAAGVYRRERAAIQARRAGS